MMIIVRFYPPVNAKLAKKITEMDRKSISVTIFLMLHSKESLQLRLEGVACFIISLLEIAGALPVRSTVPANKKGNLPGTSLPDEYHIDTILMWYADIWHLRWLS